MKFDDENEKNSFFNKHERQGLFANKIFSTGIHKVLKSQNKTLPKNALAIRFDTNNMDTFLRNLTTLFVNRKNHSINKDVMKKVVPSLMPELYKILNINIDNMRNTNNNQFIFDMLKTMFVKGQPQINSIKRKIENKQNPTQDLKEYFDQNMFCQNDLYSTYPTDTIANHIKAIMLSENLSSAIADQDRYKQLDDDMKLNFKKSIDIAVNLCFKQLNLTVYHKNENTKQTEYGINLINLFLRNPYISFTFLNNIDYSKTEHQAKVLNHVLQNIITLKDYNDLEDVFKQTPMMTSVYDTINIDDQSLYSVMHQKSKAILDKKKEELQQKEMLTAPKNNIVMRQELEIPFKNN